MNIKKLIDKEIKRFQVDEAFKEIDTSRVLQIFANQLSKRLGSKVSYNSVPILIDKDGAKNVYGIKFIIDGLDKAIRLNWYKNKVNSKVESLDIWDKVCHYNPKYNVSLTYNNEHFNLIKVIDIAEEVLKGNLNITIKDVKVKNKELKALRGKNKKLHDDPKLLKGEVIEVKVKVKKSTTEHIHVSNEDTMIDELWSDLTSEETFELMELKIKMLIAGRNNALLITGDSGIGKTFTVEQLLSGTNYKLYSGGITGPGELYRTMYKINDKYDIIVFDDLDDLLSNKRSVNILKGALDTTNRSVGLKASYTKTPTYFNFLKNYHNMNESDVASALYKLKEKEDIVLNIYNESGENEGQPKKKFLSMVDRASNLEMEDAIFPDEFVCKPRVIFISNLYIRDISKSLVGRTTTLELDLTVNQIIERIRSKIQYIKINGVSEQEKTDVIGLYSKLKFEQHGVNKLDFRTFINCCVTRSSGSSKWMKYVVQEIKSSYLDKGRKLTR